VSVSEYTLLPDVPCPLRKYQVTVTLPRPDGEEALLPPGGQAAAELAAAAIAAEGAADSVDRHAIPGVDDRGTAVHGRRSQCGEVLEHPQDRPGQAQPGVPYGNGHQARPEVDEGQGFHPPIGTRALLSRTARSGICLSCRNRPETGVCGLQTGRERGLTCTAVVSVGSFGTHSAHDELECSPAAEDS
jgi:hypothetical protein